MRAIATSDHDEESLEVRREFELADAGKGGEGGESERDSTGREKRKRNE